MQAMQPMQSLTEELNAVMYHVKQARQVLARLVDNRVIDMDIAAILITRLENAEEDVEQLQEDVR